MTTLFVGAVRKYLGAPSNSTVAVDIDGGGSVQIGDCTWDTEPYTFSIGAYWVDKDGNPKSATQDFDDLPSLITALMETDTTTE